MTESIHTPIPADVDQDDVDQVDVDAAERYVPAGQLVTIHLAGQSPFQVRVTNRERLHWEKTALKRKWGSPQDSPNLAMTFHTWSAAARAGAYAGTFEEWAEALDDYDIVQVDDVRPTQ